MSYQTVVGLRISTQAGAVPTAAQISEGELAFNIADRKIFARFGSQIEPVNLTAAQSQKLAAVGSMANRNVYISAQPPDDAIGQDGDIWLQHWS
jgi:hypothetical protein